MFGEKQQQIEDLQQQLEQAAGQLAVYQAADQTAQSVHAQLREYLEGGQTLEDAKSMAEAAVVATEQQKAVQDLSQQITQQHGAEIAAAYRREQGLAIKQQLHERFQQDGTYDKIAATAREKVEADLRQEVIRAEQVRIEAELSTPEAKAACMEEIRAALLESDELTAFRAKTRQELQGDWASDVREQVQTALEAEELDREEEYKRQARDKYLESAQGRSFRQGLAERLTREWDKKTVKDVQAELQDGALAALLAERAEQEADKLRRENTAGILLRDFERSGIQMKEIEPGSIVVLYMGTMEEGTYDPYKTYEHNGHRNYPLIMQCERKLTLVAHGDGKMKVRADSLSTSKSSWEQSLAIEEGSIVLLGNVVRENHSSKLEQCIAADVNLYYDTDPATPETFSVMPVPVINIEIDGIAARKFDEVKGAGVKQSKRN